MLSLPIDFASDREKFLDFANWKPLLEIVGFLGGLASTIALGLSSYRVFSERRDSSRRRAVETQRQFQEQISRYENAANSVSARTDLGFFLRNEVERVRFEIGQTLGHQMTYTILTYALVIIAFIVFASGNLNHPQRLWATGYFFVLSFYNLVNQQRMGKILREERAIEKMLHEKIVEIWGKPIDQRLSKP